MSKRFNYEFRPSRRDLESIAYDMEVSEDSLTDEIIREWITIVLCMELRDIRHEREKLS